MFTTNKAKVKQVKAAPPRTVTCTNCANTTEQLRYWWEQGAFVRFAGMHVAGRKAYGYVCDVCGLVSEELTKAQAKTLGA